MTIHSQSSFGVTFILRPHFGSLLSTSLWWRSICIWIRHTPFSTCSILLCLFSLNLGEQALVFSECLEPHWLNSQENWLDIISCDCAKYRLDEIFEASWSEFLIQRLQHLSSNSLLENGPDILDRAQVWTGSGSKQASRSDFYVFAYRFIVSMRRMIILNNCWAVNVIFQHGIAWNLTKKFFHVLYRCAWFLYFPKEMTGSWANKAEDCEATSSFWLNKRGRLI